MNLEMLDEVQLELDEFERQQALGRFDPGRMPEIGIRSFSSVKKIQLAVSPDCSHRLVKAAIVSSTNWSENSITQAREAGVIVESPAIASYYAGVFEFDWDNGIDEADLPDNLAAVAIEETPVDDGRIAVHPADLRII